MKVEYRTLRVEKIRADTNGEKRTVGGYAAAFYKLSEDMGGWRERIAKGAFRNSLATGDVFALWAHDQTRPLARSKAGSLRLSEDDYGLAFEMDLPDTQDGRDAYTNIRAGIVDSMSFGFIPKKDSLERGENGDLHTRTLLDVELLEISPVVWPAYPQTQVDARSIEAVTFDLEKRLKELEPEGMKTSEVLSRLAQRKLKRLLNKVQNF
jgi:HK97 family phage prohead protease